MAKFCLLAAIRQQRMIGLPEPVQGHDAFDLAVAFLNHHRKRGRRLPLARGKGGDLVGQEDCSACRRNGGLECQGATRGGGDRDLGVALGREGPDQGHQYVDLAMWRAADDQPGEIGGRLHRLGGLGDGGEALALLGTLGSGEFPRRGGGGNPDQRPVEAADLGRRRKGARGG
jgi:hypothetical protein